MNFPGPRVSPQGFGGGTIVDPFDDAPDPGAPVGTTYGTGGHLELGKVGGPWRGGLAGRWESDQLDPNDMGYLTAPDEKTMLGQLEYSWNAEGKDRTFQWVEAELEAYRTWFYAGNSGFDDATDLELRRGAPADNGHETVHRRPPPVLSPGLALPRPLPGRDRQVRDATRRPCRPLRPATARAVPCHRARLDERRRRYSSDWRRPFSAGLEVHWDGGESLDALATEGSVRWNQSQHFSHALSFGVRHNRVDTQWIGNFANDGAQAGVAGIGGIDYVFAELDQMIWDVTLRSSALLDRDRSLQLYVQPFLTRGRYSNPVWLATPDSYDLRPYGLDAGSYDFNFGAVNLNLVYRWEFRPGSSLFLVWTHNKERFEQRDRAPDPSRWRNGFDAGFPFGTEPGNTLLAKLSWWFSI